MDLDPLAIGEASLKERIWSFGPDLLLSVPSDSPLDRALAVPFGAFRGAPSPQKSAAVIPLDVAPTPGSEECAICAFGMPVYRVPRAAQLAPAAESLVSHLFARAQHHACVFHMAMVEWRGVGIIIPGERGSGKSTLALKLAELGAKYYGDDLVLVDPKGRTVRAFPKAATLKAGAFHLFGETETYHDPLRGPVRYVLPRTAGLFELPLEKVKLLVFPDCQRPAAPMLAPLEAGWVALALVQQLFGGVDGRPAALELVAELAKLPAYVVASSHLEQAGLAVLQRAEKGVA
jgi:hypothetical protein